MYIFAIHELDYVLATYDPDRGIIILSVTDTGEELDRIAVGKIYHLEWYKDCLRYVYYDAESYFKTIELDLTGIVDKAMAFK